MILFKCPVCGYLHRGEIDFHFCPVCRAPAEVFIRETNIAHYANWDTNTRLMINSMAATEELKTIARICGKNNIHDLSKNDLVSLNPELSRVTGVLLA